MKQSIKKTNQFG